MAGTLSRSGLLDEHGPMNRHEIVRNGPTSLLGLIAAQCRAIALQSRPGCEQASPTRSTAIEAAAASTGGTKERDDVGRRASGLNKIETRATDGAIPLSNFQPFSAHRGKTVE